jgi:hypothetical protein
VKLAASRWLIAVVVAFPLLCAYSCAVPLGPGYHIENESVEIAFVAQPAPQLHLRARSRLENVGNAPLTTLDVTIPPKEFLARQNLHVIVNGEDARIVEPPATDEAMGAVRISFEPAWRSGEKKEIEVEFDLAAGADPHASIAPDAFALDGAYCFPAFLAPKRLFAKGEQRANITDISVVLPSDYLATASGQQLGRKVHGATAEYRFRLRGPDDTPYVVAGSYKQRLAKSKGTSVYFWTFHDLPDGEVKAAGEQLAAAAQFFDSTFTARGRRDSSLWVVEIPANKTLNQEAPSTILADSLPGTILLDNKRLSETIGRGEVSPDEVGLLSDTWFHWIAAPDPGQTIMPASLQNYAVDAFYASRQGTSHRRTRIAEYLTQDDASRAHLEEKPIAQTTTGDSAGQVNMAVNKATVFLYALEDSCGAPALRRGIGQMLSDLRGREYGYDDLRAVLNGECGPTAGVDHLFRVWLFESGLPAGFRERYALPTSQPGAK